MVLLSSAAALQGIANHEAIAAAKTGVIDLAWAAAATYADKKIRFNVVAPGLIRTSLTQFLIENSVSMKISSAMHALERTDRYITFVRLLTIRDKKHEYINSWRNGFYWPSAGLAFSGQWSSCYGSKP